MQIISDAGTYTPPKGDEPNHWVEHMASGELSLGTYSIPAGGLDDQTSPHTEDEIYLVQSGRATLVTPAETVRVGPGSAVFVPAGETHQFTEIGEDLTLVVVFAPPYGSRTLPLSPVAYPERTGEAASSIPRRARASARSLPGSPA